MYCSQPHWSDECSKYSTLQARREKLKGSCFICLRKGHLLKECTSDKDRACAHCGKRKHHHRSLCPKLFSNSNATTNTRRETKLSNIEQKGDGPRATVTKVLMQTATTVVKDIENNSSATVHLILDSGSQRTYITERLADELKLKLGEPERLSVVTFGVNQPKQIQSQSGQVQLVLKNKDTMALTVNVVPDITGKITCFPLDPEEVEFLKNEGWEKNLADTLPTDTELSPFEMLIGNDYYFELLQPRKTDLGNNLFAFQTKFGWVFGGKT